MAHSRLGEETTKQALMGVLRDIGKGVHVVNPDRKSNLGAALHRIFIWQEIAAAAEKELALAWEAAQGKDEVCESDDELRTLDVGESEICNSKHYALMVELKTPAKRVDVKALHKALAKRFKTTVAELERIADQHKVDNKPALTKRVVERV